MSDGYWVIKINRETGEATTEPLIIDRDEAYQHSLDIEDSKTAAAVVRRRIPQPPRGEHT